MIENTVKGEVLEFTRSLCMDKGNKESCSYLRGNLVKKMSLQIGVACMYMWYFVKNYKENWEAVAEGHLKYMKAWRDQLILDGWRKKIREFIINVDGVFSHYMVNQ